MSGLREVIECRECTSDMRSVCTVVKTERRHSEYYGNTREYRLEHWTPGYRLAGSAMRLQARECWSVVTMIDGARHGGSFRTLAEVLGA